MQPLLTVREIQKSQMITELYRVDNSDGISLRWIDIVTHMVRRIIQMSSWTILYSELFQSPPLPKLIFFLFTFEQ